MHVHILDRMPGLTTYWPTFHLVRAGSCLVMYYSTQVSFSQFGFDNERHIRLFSSTCIIYAQQCYDRMYIFQTFTLSQRGMPEVITLVVRVHLLSNHLINMFLSCTTVIWLSFLRFHYQCDGCLPCLFAFSLSMKSSYCSEDNRSHPTSARHDLKRSLTPFVSTSLSMKAPAKPALYRR